MTTEDNGFFKHHGWVSSRVQERAAPQPEAGRVPAGGLVDHHADGEERASDQGEDAVAQAAGAVPGLVSRAGRCPRSGSSSSTSTPSSSGRASTASAPPRATTSARSRPISPRWRRRSSRRSCPTPSGATSSTATARFHAVGSLRPPDPGQGARARADHRRRVRRVSAQTLAFDRSEASFTEKQCLDWVKNMAARPEPETPPELEGDGEGDADHDGNAWSEKKLRKLFSHTVAHHGTSAPCPLQNRSSPGRAKLGRMSSSRPGRPWWSAPTAASAWPSASGSRLSDAR